ncbi:hypothetical protein [Sphingomonas japonica]|uniref:Uncharacterized protein n=1 Tax=Sphingomonas japonica TaxID=511662 RepID=A0ABX0U6I3_9SPHN|nr:hypothetical protein [Sphingomonas japonica]NIJ24852.1 hypothetical protein [Sphingomonas japonica]
MTTNTLERPRTDLGTMFVSVIFANGTDDDLAGLAAAIRNERVLFDERVYEQGEEIAVIGRDLHLSQRLCIVGKTTPVPDDFGPDDFVVKEADPSRHLIIQDCTLVRGF